AAARPARPGRRSRARLAGGMVRHPAGSSGALARVTLARNRRRSRRFRTSGETGPATPFIAASAPPSLRRRTANARPARAERRAGRVEALPVRLQADRVQAAVETEEAQNGLRALARALTVRGESAALGPQPPQQRAGRRVAAQVQAGVVVVEALQLATP